jgi:hypothetical protein
MNKLSLCCLLFLLVSIDALNITFKGESGSMKGVRLKHNVEVVYMWEGEHTFVGSAINIGLRRKYYEYRFITQVLIQPERTYNIVVPLDTIQTP